jgi:hypothetical protein
MKKFFLMTLALVLTAVGATTASAAKVSLDEVPFCSWDGWTADARSTGTADCAWVLDEPTGLPYGDGSVINYADLSGYTKLIVKVTSGTPRFLLNRDVDEGQWNSDESQSHLIEYPKDGGWSQKYFTKEGDDENATYIVDVKAIVKDKGFCHLHCIKGANWTDVTVTSMEVEKAENAPTVGWTNLIINSDMEGDDVSSFFTKVAQGDPAPSVILEGEGVDGSRGIKVAATSKVADAWDNQFWFRFTEVVPAGTKYRVSFDYKADADAKASTQAHAEPGDYIYWDMLGDVNFTTDWQTFTKEGTITADQAGPNQTGGLYQSIAFNLNELADANNYYFDNISFEVFKLGTLVEYGQDVIKIDFGFDTNIPALVAASGRPRLMFPKSCVKVTIDGETLEETDITSVEAFADGRFFIFLENMVDGDEVNVKFTNPTDAAYHLVYTSAAVEGQSVANYDGPANENEDVAMEEGAFAYIYLEPVIIESDPENGSFNLPNSIKEFHVTFDKLVDCKDIVATLNGKKITVSPADGFAEKIVLKRDGSANLTTGEYTIKLDNVYPEARLDKNFASFEYSFFVGKVDVDPSDTIKNVMPTEYFANCAAGGIPAGFVVDFNGETRTSESSYGSGSRMFDFAAGGDFTKALYFREGYAQYGSEEGYYLELEAGKKYVVKFNSAMWKDNGSQMTFAIMSPDEAETYLTETIQNTPNVNGNTGSPVTGSTASEFTFVPDFSGYYMLRWSVGGFNEVLLANPSVKYMPNTMGVEETALLNTAIENAKKALEDNGAERYLGPDYDALKDAVAKYVAEKDGYTAPSKFKAAAAELDAKTAALKDHRANCDNYDAQIKKSLDVERQNANNKFAKTALYDEVKAINAKYHGSSEWVNVSEDPEVEDMQLIYDFDKLTDNDALLVAINELNEYANLASLLFTEGVSAPENANGGKATGVAVLFDRMRLGLATLNTLSKKLGVTVDSTYVAGLNNALTDDDDLVEGLKLHVKKLLYQGIADASNPLFQATVDDETLEEVVPSYDMTVFVKNPNTYKQQTNMNFTPENVPGWITPEDYNAPGLTVGWGQPKNVEGVAEDCMFQTWGAAYRVQQTIEDLPAGIYNIRFAFGDRDNQEIEDSYSFAIDSNEQEYYGGCPGIGQAFPFCSNDSQTSIIEDEVIVTDGILTIGVNGGEGSHTFFNEVRLLLVSPANGFDYAGEYAKLNEQIETGVEAPAAARVRGIELYDLNGRRIIAAQKGIQIVKKYMSDGTVRIEKVIKK